MPAVGTERDLWAATRDFDVRLPPLECTEEAAAAVRDSLARSGLLLLGETHGVRENPLIVLALVRLFGIGAVALEWPPDLAPLVEQVRAGVNEPTGLSEEALGLLGGGDGRVTAGHLAVLADLGPITLVDAADFSGFPPEELARQAHDPQLWSHRDAGMAGAVLAAPPVPGGLLVVAGNAHTVLTEQPMGMPMGAVLARERPGVRTITVQYGSGRFYNFGSHSFGRPGWASNERPVLALEEGELVLRIARVREAIVLHP